MTTQEELKKQLAWLTAEQKAWVKTLATLNKSQWMNTLDSVSQALSTYSMPKATTPTKPA